MEDIAPRAKRTTSIYDLLAKLGERSAPPSAGGTAPAAEGPADGGAQPQPPYLGSGRKHCDNGPAEGEWFEVRRCGCRCWFCNKCSVGMGLSLRERLVPVLDTFTSTQMWTLTIDPTLFRSPQTAYEHVRKLRCVSTFVRQLKRWGYLHTPRYFCVVEWQVKSEMVHFHLLLDASYIPFEKVCEAWNKFRPKDAGPVQGDRPGFGAVRFSMPRFASRRHAANYACAYLIKQPEHGYPEWVMESSDIHRYSTSRGFWGGSGEPELDPDAAMPDVAEEGGERLVKAIGDRLAGCGATSVLLRVTTTINPATGERRESREFVCRLFAPLPVIAAYIGRQIEDGQRAFDVLNAEREAGLIRTVFGEKRTGPPAGSDGEGVSSDGG